MRRPTLKSGKWKVESGRNVKGISKSLTPRPRPLAPPRGISLIEVLISMFVLLFGLMGVAAIFPVASHYVLEGDKRDRSSGLAQVAFEELKARKVLRPETWLYASNAINNNPPTPLIDPASGEFELAPLTGASFNAGWTFVIDPLGTMVVGDMTDRDLFPISAVNLPNPRNPWAALFTSLNTSFGPVTNRWPVRRLTLNVNPNLAGTPAMIPGETASNTFRLRDDLAVVQPDAGDRPSIQRWQVDGTGNLLARDYLGDYSWLATVVPSTTEALLGLAPINSVKDAWYEVSTAVFYKRELVPTATLGGSAGSERLINGEFLNSSELAIYSTNNDDSLARQEVDTALDGIKPGNWIAVMGVNQVTGTFMMKWYKVQALDTETDTLRTQTSTPANNKQGRYVMVQGPEWPQNLMSNQAVGYQNLGVAILPGIVDVYTRIMQMGAN